MCNIDKFPTTIQMLNNELASYTWARLTWEQRITLSDKIAVSVSTKAFEPKAKYYFATQTYKRGAVVCETLSQMQFVSQNEYKIGEAITILNKL